MEYFTLNKTVTAKEEGLLLKNYLIDLGISKRMLADIKFDGGDLLINGEHVTVRYKLHNGDRLTILFPEEKVSEGLKPAPIPLDILFEDEHVLVLNKKPYIPSIPSREHPEHSIANGLLHHYAEQSVRLTVHLVNRLDRDTSGVMLVAKHRFAHSLLSKAQKSGAVKRTYRAFTHGMISEKYGTIRAKIARKGDSIIERMVDDTGQEAVTHFKVRAVDAELNMSDVALALETGRTHQIRVHMKYLGHPLIGDTLYGGTSERMNRQALHSETLVFPHPMTGEELTFSAPLPEDMKSLLL
ncbi:RluA family pseudouridine synthase [Bacillus pumilus]|uniref:RluA family pseudouridine synthase n=1 Tax=Bacillus pumilus TaxID=1408 RepID=UPI0023DC3EE7|nr:RluA family pseudouridine synthase [Bacillus pumilus]MDF2002220.1 RluA family pseudouridine synthase [Bacillus pumilus]MDF2023475.1 RluA family pseudouridine synthase [Bacillus pumilus]MDF2027102.1 RluA family pseudouridine synthase [Bacillus pumilus]MDF2088285.1 RluA family pseudouridine synthase [Bacillus pumilus]